jgi:hypothetical protein
MVAILVKGKGGTLPPEPVVFTKDYVKHRLLSTKKYPQGTSGLVVKSHKGLLGGVTHYDLRLPDGEFVCGVPIDYFAVDCGC